MKRPKELPIPQVVIRANDSRELVRIWITDDSQTFTLDIRIIDDPAAWGIIMVDLARHVAAAYNHAEGKDRDEVLKRIKEGFDAEWYFPTDTPS